MWWIVGVCAVLAFLEMVFRQEWGNWWWFLLYGFAIFVGNRAYHLWKLCIQLKAQKKPANQEERCTSQST